MSYDTLIRISLIIGIYSSLQVLYPEATLADAWVRMPNSMELTPPASLIRWKAPHA